MFFYKLRKRVLSFLWKWLFSSTQFLCGFLSERDWCDFRAKIWSFSEKSLDSFLCYELGTWVLGFLTLKKFEYWFLIKRFLTKKTCVCLLQVFRAFHDKLFVWVKNKCPPCIDKLFKIRSTPLLIFEKVPNYCLIWMVCLTADVSIWGTFDPHLARQ